MLFPLRHEHARDLDFRFDLRRDEAREQAERHRIQMEIMLDRVTQIPPLFERHSQVKEMKELQVKLLINGYTNYNPAIKAEDHLQSFQSSLQLQSGLNITGSYKPKKSKLMKRHRPSSVDSYVSRGSGSRSNSGSLTSSSGTLLSSSQSFKSSDSKKSEASTGKSEVSNKKKSERGHLKVSINETAELIEDRGSNSERFSINSQVSGDRSSANVENDKL